MASSMNWYQLATSAAQHSHLHSTALPQHRDQLARSRLRPCCSSTHRTPGSDPGVQLTHVSRRSVAHVAALLALVGAVPAPASALGYASALAAVVLPELVHLSLPESACFRFKKELKKRKAREEDYIVAGMPSGCQAEPHGQRRTRT